MTSWLTEAQTVLENPEVKLVPAEETYIKLKAKLNKKVIRKGQALSRRKKCSIPKSYLIVVFKDTTEEVCIYSLKAQKAFSHYTQGRNGSISAGYSWNIPRNLSLLCTQFP